MIAAIVLAAGASRRLGQSKQLVELDGEPLVRRAARLALEAGLKPVVVVVNDRATRAALGELDVLSVDNPNAATMGASIAKGIPEVRSARGVVITTVDQPFVTSTHLKALCADPEHPAATAYAGTFGVPAYFPSAFFERLGCLEDGAKRLLADARKIPLEEAAIDLDTPADLEQLRASTVRK